MGPLHNWFWCRRRSFIQSLRCHCQRSCPQGDPPAGCSCCNCWLNKCRLIHCLPCCCWRCRKSWIPIVDQILLCRKEVLSIWKIIIPFRRRFLFLCYIRLIESNGFQWCHCHCYWRCGRLPFAIVGSPKKCAKQLAFVWQNPEASTGLQYTFYTASHFVHTQEENKVKKWGVVLCFDEEVWNYPALLCCLEIIKINECMVAFLQESTTALHPLSKFPSTFLLQTPFNFAHKIYWKYCIIRNTWQI
jgi:hypothetical protein